MITSLKLRNFKKHSELDATFTGGLNLITGPNWAGKTTLLHGIMFALGGSAQVPGAPQRRGTNTGMEVEMGFLVDGVPHRVERKKTSANLYRGTELLASGTAPVNTAVESLLGMPMRRFRQLRYAEQKETHALLTLGATELHKILDEITKAEDVTRAIDRLKEVITAETARVEAIPEEDCAADAQRLEELEDQADLAGGELEKARLHLIGEEEEERRLSSYLSRARQRAEQWRTLERKRAALTAEISTLSSEESRRAIDLQALGEPPLEVWLAQQEAELEKLEREEKAYDKAMASAQHVRAEVTRLKALLAQREAEAVPLEEALQRAQQAYDGTQHEELLTRHEAALKERARLEEALTSAKVAVRDSACATCKRPFKKGDQAKLETELQYAQTQFTAAQQVAEEISEQLKEFSRAASAMVRAKGALDSVTSRAAETAKELARVEESAPAPIPERDFSDTPRLRRELTEARVKLKECSRAASSLARLRTDLAEAQGRLAEADGAVEQLEHDPAALAQSEEDHKAVQMAVSTLKAEIAKLTADFAALRASADALRQSIAAATARQAVRSKALARSTAAKTLQKFLRDSRDRYAGQVWSCFMAAASDFVSTCTDGKIDEIRRTEDGKFTYLEDGQEMQVKEASGAQAAIMGLSVQLALAESAGCPLDTLLIDEPTADMSPENSMATSAMLASLGKQIITISHSPYDSSVCSNQIVLGGE